MADYTSETVVRTIHRWIIPCAEPWGAPAEEISKAWAVAAAEYRRAHGLPEDAALSGDALRFHTRDEEIVIEFATEQDEDWPCSDFRNALAVARAINGSQP